MIFLGIDGTNWVHQLWHARGGQGVLEGFAGWLRATIEHVRPAATVVAFDARSFRYDLLPQYKAGRPEKPTGLKEALSNAQHACDCLDFAATVCEEGFEADDCLATLARIGRAGEGRVVIASPDKDLRQCLVDGRVSILRKFSAAGGKLSRAEWLTAGGLRREFGLEPEQWTSYQALAGDTGDNIQGVSGWGPVTTKKALAVGRTLEGCLANVWKLPISNRQQSALLAFRPRAALTLQLVTLRDDVGAVADALR